MKRQLFPLLLIISIILTSSIAMAGIVAQYSFDSIVPQNINTTSDASLQIDTTHYKDGSQALLWSWSAPSKLTIADNKAFTASRARKENGIMLWIYNTSASETPLTFQFQTLEGNTEYSFDFGMDFRGWRACWIRYMDMLGEFDRSNEIAKMVISSPLGVDNGSIFIDRLTISDKPLNAQVTPDKQIPTNNKDRRMWHWGRLWEWEQNEHDIPLQEPSVEQKQMLVTVTNNIVDIIEGNLPSAEAINKKILPNAIKELSQSGIEYTSDGGTRGAAMVSDDESTPEFGDLKIAQFQNMLWAFALDKKVNNSSANTDNFFLVLDHMIDQGFDVGSSLGTNHHYGYQTRNIFAAAWIMRREIAKHPKGEKYVAVLSHWSALPETRVPYEYGRDETLDSWNTLLQAKVISAMIHLDDAQKMQQLRGLSRWVSGSMMPSPGTVGGIKADGTTFHHGGMYPAYTVGAMATLGQFCKITTATEFVPTIEARKSFKLALQTLRNYTNTTYWGLGVAGRHPMSGNIPMADINAFGQLAAAGDLTGSGKSIDHELAADFLRLKGNNKELKALFKKENITPAAAPQGFFVYNYGAVGIHRRNNWMVTLKAYNSDVWCSEIYTADNRYGRYQSYGTAPIINADTSATNERSMIQAGWDWNRAPGATTIHLPYNLLESPLPGTLMERNPENFSGASSLEGQNGVLAFKLRERERKNFTKDAKALKSVFCFDNRMVFLGSDITNNNETYPTETTLFQLSLNSKDETVMVEREPHNTFPLNIIKNNVRRLSIADTKGNFYLIKSAPWVKIIKQEQSAPNDKTRALAKGNFATAYIDHGTAPQGEKYEYAVFIEPSAKEINKLSKKRWYKVIRQDSIAHIVKDIPTGITTYVCWQAFTGGKRVKSIDKETIVMERMQGKRMILSVCTPELGLTQKSYSTNEPSSTIVKQVALRGAWQKAVPNEAVTLNLSSTRTLLKVNCIDGKPIEIILKPFK